jgi:hypothetical protein
MSSIAFHFPDVTLRIGGRESAWFRVYVTDIAEGLVKLALPYGTKPKLGWTHGDHANQYEIILRTVWAVSSAPGRLAVLFGACCENNLLIDGKAFPEVADTIDEGRRVGIFREETQGYDGIAKVVDRFRQGGRWCALSHSVTDGFPRPRLTVAKTVALLRKEGPTLVKGELAAPSFFPDGPTILTMTPDELINLTSATKEF